MKVGIDARMIQNSGIGTTIRGLLDHLGKARLAQTVLFTAPGWKNPYPCQSVEVPYPVYSISQHWGYAAILKRHSLSVFHMPHYDVPLLYRGPFVATVHDLIHFLYPQYSTKPLTRLYSRWLLAHVAKRARRIIAVSDNTQADLIRFFPKAAGKTSIIHPAVDASFRPIDLSSQLATLRKYNLKPGYILYVGNLRGSKNTEGLLAGYAYYRRNASGPLPLVLVGKNTYGSRLKLPEGAIHIEFAEQTDLPAFYSAATVFVFPSWYEGFGLPPLEAMACGTPVIAYKKGGALETIVDGSTGTFFDEPTAESLSQVMQLFDQSRYSSDTCRAQAERFNRKNFEKKILEKIKQMMSY
jgi:glycosyltransferase involved in cell wall biosynthesis